MLGLRASATASGLPVPLKSPLALPAIGSPR